MHLSINADAGCVRQQLAPEQIPVPQDFLQAMTSLKEKDLKTSYALTEFEGGVTMKEGKFYIAGKEVTADEMAARTEREGARILPSLTGAYAPAQSSVYMTAAALDGKPWKFTPRKNSKRMDKEVEVTPLEAGTALLALSTKRSDIKASGILVGMRASIKIDTFTSDGVIDASEIGAVTNGGWVELMKMLYKVFSGARQTTKAAK